MEIDGPKLKVNDRVRALRRPGFPEGVVMDVLADGFVLVRWDGDLLETAHQMDIEKVDATT